MDVGFRYREVMVGPSHPPAERMPVFIDESGDTSPVAGGGKPYFRLAAVWVPDYRQAETIREALRQLKQSLGLRGDYEFKFSKTHQHPDRRAAFFNTVLGHDFHVAACSIDKTDAYWGVAPKGELQWACVTSLAAILWPHFTRREQEAGETFRRESVSVDDNQDVEFLALVKRQFRGLPSRLKPGSSLCDKVTFYKSHADALIQLADMACGAAGAMIDGDPAEFSRIAARSLGVLRLP